MCRYSLKEERGWLKVSHYTPIVMVCSISVRFVYLFTECVLIYGLFTIINNRNGESWNEENFKSGVIERSNEVLLNLPKMNGKTLS